MNKNNKNPNGLTDSTEMFGTLMSAFCKEIPKEIYKDVRRLYVLAWAVIGVILTQSISLSEWGEVVQSRAEKAASHQKRFARWMKNEKVDAFKFYKPLIANQLKNWPKNSRFRIAIDTSVLPNDLLLIRIGLIYRGRAIPLTWKVILHKSATISYETYEPLLEDVIELMPESAIIEFSADSGFFHTELIRFCKTHKWHFRLRAPGDTLVRRKGGTICSMSDLCPPKGHAHFHHHVRVTGSLVNYVHLALANPKHTKKEDPWYIVSDEPTDVHTFDDYGFRFDIEESFLDDKSNGFQVEDSRLQTPEQMQRLFLVLAVATLHLTSIGTAVVDDDKRSWVDTHWDRGMSYLKIGWQWVRQQFRKSFPRFAPFFLSSEPDPVPAISSRRQSRRFGIGFSIAFNPP